MCSALDVPLNMAWNTAWRACVPRLAGEKLGQGREKVKAYLHEHPNECAELERAVRDKMMRAPMPAIDAKGHVVGYEWLPLFAAVVPVVCLLACSFAHLFVC